MSALDELIERYRAEWRAAVAHPFIEGVRDGGLPEAAFQSWLVQDYLFVSDLLAFQARLLAIAPRSAQAVLAAGLVALEAELGWMEGHGRRLRLDLDVGRNPATAAYRHYLEEVLEQGFAPAITTLWALERTYLEAWRNAAPGAGAYREFVEHWTVPEFASYVGQLAQVTEAAGASEQAFLRTARLEHDFWEHAFGHELH